MTQHSSEHHRVLIVGGGTAGITVASRLLRKEQEDVAVIEPSEKHYYQPLWTLVGGGCAPVQESVRAEAEVMPKGVTWIHGAAAEVDPEAKAVTLGDGRRIGYDFLVVCPGIQLDWGKVNGMPEAMASPDVSSNYTYETAPKSCQLIQRTERGTALFTMPAGPIKCAGAPQKICYLAADYWRRTGVLSSIRPVLVLPTPAMFGVPEFSKVLEQVVARYGIEVHLSSEVVELDPASKTATIVDHANGDAKTQVTYDMAHVTPPQSAPDWIKQSPLADPDSPFGYVQVDKNTHQHVRFPEVFALGDAGSTPNSKTGAAIRKQAPVVVDNLLAVMEGKELPAAYDGYASCPITTARNRMLLAEFDYTMKPHPTLPLIDTQRERYDMWLLKRYGLPYMYWNLMLKGLA
jgi:sulfide:quinone oxidoreductase